MFLSKNISILRKRKGLSQEKFAEKIGESSRGTVAKWETGETKPSIEQIDSMAQFFDVSLDQLVRYDFSKNETYDAIDNSKEIVKLISGMLHGNEDILKFVDVKVLIGVVIDLTLSKAEAEEAIDKRRAVALYMEAGALGEQKAYERAYHLVEELLNGIGKIKSEEELDRAIMYVNKNIEDINLSECDYKRVKELYDKSLEQIDDQIRQYDILCCCVMKAYLIKTFDKEQEKNKKVEKFIEYCLNEINCYSEKEIVVLSLYILDDYRTNRAFKKIKNNEDVIKNILNVTWDLYHIRLIEQIMLYDNLNKKDEIILSYFGTADKGLIDVMQINPAKAVVIMDNKIYIIHQINIENVCKKQELLDNAYNNDYLREKKIKNINFSEMRKQLEFQILSKVCN